MGVYRDFLDQAVADDFKITPILTKYILEVARMKYRDEDDRQEFATKLLELIVEREIKTLSDFKIAINRARGKVFDDKRKILQRETFLICNACKKLAPTSHHFYLRHPCKHCGAIDWSFKDRYNPSNSLYDLTHSSTFIYKDGVGSGAVYGRFWTFYEKFLKGKKINPVREDWHDRFLEMLSERMKFSKISIVFQNKIIHAIKNDIPISGRANAFTRYVFKTERLIISYRDYDALREIINEVFEELEGLSL
jgi:hypothetical protein